MARSQEQGQTKDRDNGQDHELQVQAKASKKSAQKAAKKTAKKAAKRAPRQATSKARQAVNTSAAAADAENPFAAFDRSRLREKMRVFQLAKELEIGRAHV